MRALIFGTALMLAGCQTVDTRGQAMALTPAQVTAIQDGVRTAMREPASAEFLGQPRAVRLTNGEVVVCGAVKGRNGFGGMTDWQPYIGGLQGERFVPSRVGGSVRDMEVTMMTCRSFGVHG
ncbi:MAG: hypothetical protein FD152_3671 [Xanthobacteraceae bacterium]|nr:MAG: hypothetical protein FD152_3671 [Xanthobacteraceae bacterium]